MISSPLKVMLVDDIAGRAAILEQALTDAGHKVVARLTSAQRLSARVLEFQPDIVIIDLDSPDRDTLENMSILSRDNPKPIIMFAQQDDSNTIAEAVKAGVSAYIVDGLSAKRVKPIIDVAIARFREFQALRNELEHTRSRLEDRKIIDKAKGLLMKQRDFSEDEAYHALRKMAMERNRKIVEVARNVVDVFEVLGNEKPGKGGGEN